MFEKKPDVDLFNFLSNENVVAALDKLSYTEGWYENEIRWKQVAFVNKLPYLLAKLLSNSSWEDKNYWYEIDRVHVFRTPKIQKPRPEEKPAWSVVGKLSELIK